MKPTWKTSDGSVQLYLGDCLEVLPTLHQVDTMLTDPIWPNNSVAEFADVDAVKLLRDAVNLVEAERLVIHMGSDSDPRLLEVIPKRWEFRRVCWLRFVRPNYKGRHLNGSEIAYVFGPPLPASRWPGRRHLLPGESPTEGEHTMTCSEPRTHGHPCPRRLTHVSWLVEYFAGGEVLDPFMGSGTTGVACVPKGRKFIGIEKEPKYFEIAVKRIEAELNRTPLFEEPPQVQRVFDAH